MFKKTKRRKQRSADSAPQKVKLDTKTGLVIEALPDALFKLRYEDESETLAFLSGKMKMHRIRVLIGDKVKVEIDPYGGKARIVQRL